MPVLWIEPEIISYKTPINGWQRDNRERIIWRRNQRFLGFKLVHNLTSSFMTGSTKTSTKLVWTFRSSKHQSKLMNTMRMSELAVEKCQNSSYSLDSWVPLPLRTSRWCSLISGNQSAETKKAKKQFHWATAKIFCEPSRTSTTKTSWKTAMRKKTKAWDSQDSKSK